MIAVVPPSAAATVPDSKSSADRMVAGERHVQVGVRVDAAGKDELAGRVDHAVGGGGERRAHGGDRLAVDEHVGGNGLGGGHDATVADQRAQRGASRRDYT